MAKTKKQAELDQTIAELTQDLQRTRADFENYRKRVDQEKQSVRDAATSTTILKLLPVVDTIERALAHTPEDLKGNKWVQGIVALDKNLQKAIDQLGLQRIEAKGGTTFDPNLHQAVMFEEGDGETEVIAEELQPGYVLNGTVIRHSMVKVKKM
ncbi:nucleotide exchange factor GrpE [Candidatus Saccharibacteria bacterium]|nr:MAG: nucleotide exchange factor GrpE [Candidatus Saccharibacteria bacterium]